MMRHEMVLSNAQRILRALDFPKTARELASDLKMWEQNIFRKLRHLEAVGWVEPVGLKRGSGNRGSRLWRRRVRLVEEVH